MRTSKHRDDGGRRKSAAGFGVRWTIAAGLLAALMARAQITEVGGIARDFTVVNRATGATVHLTDFAGQVVVLDFFAYWCGPCQASSPDVEQNIREYYLARGGNAHGVSVTVLSVNIESGNEPATDQFIQTAGLDLVVNDYTGAAYGQFEAEGIPLFVIINGVSQSPSHQTWQVLYRQAGYAGASTLRGAIDSVQASDPTAPPGIIQAPQPQTLPVGQTLRLEVRATGADPLRYQWYKDDQPLAGATAAVFRRASAQLADSGCYAVEVANAFGTNRTSAVNVRVAEPGTARTFSYAGAPVSIPDNSPVGITTTVNVSESLDVLVLKLSLRITHTYRGDLRVSLRSPAGGQVILHDFSGDSADNYVLTASTVSGFAGESAQGSWTLWVIDGYPDDTGRLESWSLEITPSLPSLATAFAQWIRGYGTLTEAQRAPGADPDGDGVPNLLEYVLAGHSPLTAAPAPALAIAPAAPDYFEYTATWRPGVDASACALWICEDLGSGTWQEVADRGTDIVVDRSVAGQLAVRCRRTLPAVFLQLRAGPIGL